VAQEFKICKECGQINPGGSRYCLECGTPFEKTPPPQIEERPAEERRIVSVLFADLSGFTSYSERVDVEEVKALAHEAGERLGEIVKRYGGVVDKIIGDAVMAVFGAPVSHEDDPERAVRAALDMQSYVTEHSETFAQLPLTIGINSGEAMYAPIGGQHTVIGDTVNTAARLQTAASKGEVLVGQSTYLATSDVIEYETCTPITAKNKAEPVPAWKAINVKGAETQSVVRSAPLLGRAAEFDRLWELWERSRTERRPYLATVIGHPGLGKTRLLNEVTNKLGHAAAVYWGRCLPYGEGITYWPIIEILKDAAEIRHDDDPDSVSRKLGGFLEGLGIDDLDQLRTIAASLSNLVAAPTTPRGTFRTEKISQPELHWGIRRMLQLESQKRPLALVVEDLHWAEPTLLELLVFLLEEPATAPMLILGSARPEIKDSAPPILTIDRWRRVVELQALSDRDSEALLTELVGAAGLPEGTVGAVLVMAGGNPLFLEETVRMLADMHLDRERLADEVEAGEVPVPNNLQALIGARLDMLPRSERALAQNASVVGGQFWLGAIRHLDGVRDVEMGLDALQARDIVHEEETSSVAGEREYAFKHMLIRDVAYSRLPKAKRAGLHERCGDWIAQLPGGDEFIEIVAYHLEQACRLAQEVKKSDIQPPILQAVEALRRAAEKAENREGTKEADRYYGRALELVGDRWPETSTDLRYRKASMAVALGDFERATEAMNEVADLAFRVDRPDLRCLALLMLAHLGIFSGKGAEAHEHLVEAEKIAEQTGEAKLRIRAALEFATYREHYEGALDAAAQQLRSAVAAAEEAGDLFLRTLSRLRLGTLLINMGKLADAEQELERCVELGRGQGSVREEARATYFLSLVKSYRSGIDEAEKLAEQSLEWLQRSADRSVQLQNLKSLGQFALEKQDYVAAEARLKEALPLAMETGGWIVCEIERYLAEALSWQGRAQEAREAATSARQCSGGDYLYARAAVAMAEAFAFMAEGDGEGARKAFAEAIPPLEQQGFALELGEALVSYGRMLRHLEDESGAKEQLEAAREIFARVEADARVASIEKELAAA
jgi:predicted ATPase/class 3 adenylate cyclase